MAQARGCPGSAEDVLWSPWVHTYVLYLVYHLVMLFLLFWFNAFSHVGVVKL